MVRALASHQCVQGSIPGPGVICGLSLLLVLALLRGFFSGFSGFPPSSKINISKFQFDRKFEDHEFVSRRLLCATLVKQSQFIYLLTGIGVKYQSSTADYIALFNARSTSSLLINEAYPQIEPESEANKRFYDAAYDDFVSKANDNNTIDQ